MKNLESMDVTGISYAESINLSGGSWGSLAKLLWETGVGAAVEWVIETAANSLTAQQAADYRKYHQI